MQDAVMPTGPWAFDAEVADCFDDMLARSIPDYEGMRRECYAVGRRFVRHGTDVVDLGCSRGEALAPFIREFGAYNRYVGVEVSPPMLAACRGRFAGLIDRKVVDIRDDDLRSKYPPARASLTLAILTLQFTPIEHRSRIVRRIFEATEPGGALVLVEKVLGATADLDSALVELHHAMKAEHGYSRDAIDRKRMALSGVLVPVTARWNEDLLRDAGFRQVECFWRRLNFAGWLAIRD